MIEAMPEILEACPNALYLVLGATHPHVLAQSGNRLRDGLQQRVWELGIADHVRFIDEYVELDLLTRYLQAADVYVTPYHNPDQITSGTLSYAVGLGKPVVSTGYVHANELLGNGTGILVPFHAPEALAKAVTALLTNDRLRDQLARRAYRVGRTMTWARYAETALESFPRLRPAKANPPSMPQLGRFPVIGNSAVERLTDGTGIFQHSRFGVADRDHGYCIDDNARALALVSVADDLPRETRSRLGNIYAAFVQHAWNPDVNAFRNFMHFDRHWLEDQGSSDSNGRTLWALALAATRHCDPLIREWATELYRETWKRLDVANAPRATAFFVLAAVEMQTSGLGPVGTMSAIRSHSVNLLDKLRFNRRQDWNWFESVLAYDNCRLPEALIRAGHLLGDDAMICYGKAALGWIMRLQMAEEGWFRPVGSTSFGKFHAKPQPFDQQPIEAFAAIDACLAANDQHPTREWIDRGEAAFAWFTGANDLGILLADTETGECCDGLTPEGANANRGAESVLAWQAAARQILRLRETMLEVETTTERACR